MSTPTIAGYKPESINYSTLHSWASKHFTDPGHCEICGVKKLKLDWAIRQKREYSRDQGDWMRLCRSCHISYDHKPKKQCRNGHDFTEENTFTHGIKRWCRVCRRAANRKLYYKKKFEEIRNGQNI